jgi:O-antigen ligase
MLGYGYGGFWTPARVNMISEEENWAVPNGHSAYIDYLLALGAVGLLAYAFLLFAGIIRAFRLHRLSQNSAFAFCGVLLVFYAVDGLLESNVFWGMIPVFPCLVVLARLALVPEHADEF